MQLDTHMPRQREYTEIAMTVLVSTSLVKRLAVAQKESTRERLMIAIADEVMPQLDDGQQLEKLEAGLDFYIKVNIMGLDPEEEVAWPKKGQALTDAEMTKTLGITSIPKGQGVRQSKKLGGTVLFL